jgi:hypothetical protein
MEWCGWPSVFQKHGATLADEIVKWLIAIFWRPSDTRLVPAHLTATPSANTLFRSVKSILRFPALTASTALKHYGQKIHQAQRWHRSSPPSA